MFRLFRLLFLLFAAFIAGILYERNAMADICQDKGGRVENGICVGAR